MDEEDEDDGEKWLFVLEKVEIQIVLFRAKIFFKIIE